MPVTGDRVEALVDLLAGEAPRSLVFVRTRHGADRLAEKLKRAGIRTGVMHGDKTQSARERALGEFASGRVKALVATDVAARGIDVEDVTHVINFDPPDDADTYTHRIGRTGRAGRPGTGITLVSPEHGRAVTILVEQLQLETEYEAEGLQLAGGFYRATASWTTKYWWDGMRRRKTRASILAGFPRPPR